MPILFDFARNIPLGTYSRNSSNCFYESSAAARATFFSEVSAVVDNNLIQNAILNSRGMDGEEGLARGGGTSFSQFLDQ